MNAVIDAYRDYDLEQKSRQGRKTLEDIASRKAEVEENLRSLERSKQNFMEKNPKGLGAALAVQLADWRYASGSENTRPTTRVLSVDQRMQTMQAKLGGSRRGKWTGPHRPGTAHAGGSIPSEQAVRGGQAEYLFRGLLRQRGQSAVPAKRPSPQQAAEPAGRLHLGVFLAVMLVFLLENPTPISTIEDIEAS